MGPISPYLARFQRVLAAFLAISLRRLALMPSARALPPMRPSATAAAFLPSSVVRSSISPVAILPIMTAAPITSAGRFSPFGPRGMSLSPANALGLTALAGDVLADARTGKNDRHAVAIGVRPSRWLRECERCRTSSSRSCNALDRRRQGAPGPRGFAKPDGPLVFIK